MSLFTLTYVNQDDTVINCDIDATDYENYDDAYELAEKLVDDLEKNPNCASVCDFEAERVAESIVSYNQSVAEALHCGGHYN